MGLTGGSWERCEGDEDKELSHRISVARAATTCIGFHVKAAVDRGATREEILETLGMAIYMGAGPSAMYASHALAAYTQFAAPKADAA